MISKGCLYRIVRVKYLDCETSEGLFKSLFDDLPEIPPKREIDFGIDLLQNTNPI